MAEKRTPISTRTCKAIATSWGFDVVGGYDVAKVMFELRSGEGAGQSRHWTGFLSDSSFAITARSLRHCGWTGDTLEDMTGMGDAEVELVLETHEGKNGKPYEEVRWVNRPPALQFKSPIVGPQLKALSDRMARLTIESKRSYGDPPPRAVNAASSAQASAAARPAETSGAQDFSAPPNYDGPDEEDNIPF